MDTKLFLSTIDNAARYVVNGEKTKAAIATRKYLEMGKEIPCATLMRVKEAVHSQIKDNAIEVIDKSIFPDTNLGALKCAFKIIRTVTSTLRYTNKRNKDLVKVFEDNFEKQYPKTGKARRQIISKMKTE